MSSNPETLKLAKKYLKRIKEFGEEDFRMLCVKVATKEQAGLPTRSVESILGVEEPDEPKKPEPEKHGLRKCHGACKNFSAAQYGTGSCGLSENPYPVAPDKAGCKDWEGASKENDGEEQLLVESLHKKMKTLMSMS